MKRNCQVLMPRLFIIVVENFLPGGLTGCTRSSLLYFISLFFSTIGLISKSFQQKLFLSI